MFASCHPHRSKAKVLLEAVLLAAVPALLGGGAERLRATDLPRDRDAWLEVKTANFRLWSDAGERRTRAIAAELEQLRSGMLRLNPDLSAASSCPTYVYVFKDRFAFLPYRFHFQGKRVEVAGYILGRPWGNYVAIDGDPRTDALHSVRHEYVHYLLHNNFAHLPLWLDEGLAELYGTFRLVDGEARVGEPVAEHIRWLRENQLIPLRQLFAVDDRSKDYHEGIRQGVFYAESWALTHYLLLGNAARRPQLSQMFRLMQDGATQEDAFNRAFAGNYDALEQELLLYIRKPVFSYAHLPLEVAAEARAAVQPLAWPDALYRLGDLLLNVGPEERAAAAEHFQAALAANPRHGLALAGLGQIEEQAGRRPEALADYEKAVQLAPDEPYAHYLLGTCLLEQAREGSRGAVAERDGQGDHGGQVRQGGAPAERAAAELARTAELAPDFADAWVRLGLALLSYDPASQRTMTALETAHRLLPARADVTVNLASSYARRGERQKAAAMIERARAVGASPEQLAQVREALLLADRDDAGKLVAAGKIEEAIPILERVAAGTQIKDVAELVAADLGRLRQALARQRFVAAYNQAVELANHGDTAAAIARLEALLATAPEPADADQARHLLDQLQARRQHRGN
ncbi:MAG TPA: tetratricopeptide repeat protein [Thermoanaerobaculia bacterium]